MKMHIFKRYLLIAVAPALLLFSEGCTDFLEEELISDVSAASYYTTPKGFEDAVKAAYTPLKDFYGRERGMSLTCFGTDEFTNGADGSFKSVNFYDQGLNATMSIIREVWFSHYGAINQCNAAINRSSKIEGLDEATKNTRLAEIRFLRALYYFNATNLWGDVHFQLEETEGVVTEANRTPVKDIMAQGIIPDLEFAISNLPVTQKDYGRATKPAAEFMLAKVLMTRAYTSYAEGSDAQRAFDLMKGVINNYSFKLLTDYAKVFDQDNELHSEVVWSIQNTADQILNAPDGNNSHLYYLMEYDILPGMTRDIANGRPWKRFRPTNWMLEQWDRTKDSRYDKGFKHAFISNRADNIPKDANGNPKFTVGDTAVFIPHVEWSSERVAASRYLVVLPSQYDEKRFPTVGKFLDPKRPDRQATAGSRDWMLMRLADAYLIAAEAAVKMGKMQDAADMINVIRRRAAWPGKEKDMEITAADMTLDYVLDERARELFGEMHRWFDLTRTGKLVERVKKYNPQASAIQDHHVLRPIPQEQLDRANDGTYAQNPGY